MSQGAKSAYVPPGMRDRQQPSQSQSQPQQHQQQQHHQQSPQQQQGGFRPPRSNFQRGSNNQGEQGQYQRRQDGENSQRYKPPGLRNEQHFSKPRPSLQPAGPVHRIRITLVSPHLRNLEQVCNDLVTRSKEKKLDVHGPVRFPTKVLKITTRKTPCGEGSKTWDRFQMRIHKRLIDIYTHPEIIRQIVSYALRPGVDVDVSMERTSKDHKEAKGTKAAQ